MNLHFKTMVKLDRIRTFFVIKLTDKRRISTKFAVKPKILFDNN